MRCVGCTEAINFDGGGSSTLWVNNFGVLNVPSDGHNRAVKNGLFITAPVQGDNSITEIRFADYVKKADKGELYAPVIYGYNSKGLLVDTDVDGFTLQCGEALGEVQADGRSVLLNGDGTYALTAVYNGLTASIAVTVGDDAGVALLESDALKIFPNPVKSGENVSLVLDCNALVSVYDSLGRIVSKPEVFEKGTAVLAVADLPEGLYFVSVDNKSGHIRNLKLMIK